MIRRRPAPQALRSSAEAAPGSRSGGVRKPTELSRVTTVKRTGQTAKAEGPRGKPLRTFESDPAHCQLDGAPDPDGRDALARLSAAADPAAVRGGGAHLDQGGAPGPRAAGALAVSGCGPAPDLHRWDAARLVPQAPAPPGRARARQASPPARPAHQRAQLPRSRLGSAHAD